MTATLLLLVLLPMVAVPRATAQDDFLDDQLKVWPCPSAEVLAPCTCYADDFLNLFLDCQSLPDLATLTAVFNNSFPFKKFARLQIGNSDFEDQTLTADVFKDFSFREVIMFDNKLTAVAPDAFQKSKKELTFFEYIDFATDFPLPVDMAEFVQVREIMVASGCTEIPSLVAPSLISLTIRCSQNVSLVGVITDLPMLTTLHLHHSHLTTVGTGDFTTSPSLVTVTMNNNDLSGDDTTSLSFERLFELDLSFNEFSDMPHITGMAASGTVRINNNTNIKSLSQTNTLALLTDHVQIEAEGITLKCDCNLQWLLGEDDSNMYLNNQLLVSTECGEESADFSWDDIREILNTLCSGPEQDSRKK